MGPVLRDLGRVLEPARVARLCLKRLSPEALLIKCGWCGTARRGLVSRVSEKYEFTGDAENGTAPRIESMTLTGARFGSAV